MAQLVAGIGVPHSPHYPSQYAKDGPEETPRLYRDIKAVLDAAKPDAVVVIANDHFNTFFMNNFPTFAIGVSEETYGPNDQTKMPTYRLKVPFCWRSTCATQALPRASISPSSRNSVLTMP
jgi:hypothetical protein